jgi:hypothetical protein
MRPEVARLQRQVADLQAKLAAALSSGSGVQQAQPGREAELEIRLAAAQALRQQRTLQSQAEARRSKEALKELRSLYERLLQDSSGAATTLWCGGSARCVPCIGSSCMLHYTASVLWLYCLSARLPGCQRNPPPTATTAPYLLAVLCRLDGSNGEVPGYRAELAPSASDPRQDKGDDTVG